MTTRRSYIWKSAAGVLAVLLLGELAIRALALSRRRDFRIVPELGRVIPAGTTVRWGAEGFGETHFVADGEIATPYSNGRTVIVLGDSHTEAFQVDDRDKYVSVAETLLHGRGIPADLRNFGRSGLSMADYVWLVPVMRRRFQPAAIVIQIDEHDFDFHAFGPTAGNHFVVRSPTSIEVAHASEAEPQPGPEPRAVRLLNRLVRSSQLVDYARYRYELSRNRAEGAAAAPPPGLEPGLSIRLQAQLLREAAGETPVILLRLPYAPYAPAHTNPAFPALRRVLPWRFLDPSGELLRSREAGHDPRTFYNTPMGGGHLNVAGHAIVARMLADELGNLLR